MQMLLNFHLRHVMARQVEFRIPRVLTAVVAFWVYWLIIAQSWFYFAEKLRSILMEFYAIKHYDYFDKTQN